MVKKAVFFHGTDGSPSEYWWPWLKDEFKSADYEVFAPTLPNNHTPNKSAYDNFLKESGWNFQDNILVGHSSGATTILNLLSSDWFPKVKAVVLIGTFLNENLVKNAEWYEEGQFDNLFLDEYKVSNLTSKAGQFIFIHGDNDPHCDYEDAKKLCYDLNGQFITINNGHHLGGTWGHKEFPEVIEALTYNNLM